MQVHPEKPTWIPRDLCVYRGNNQIALRAIRIGRYVARHANVEGVKFRGILHLRSISWSPRRRAIGNNVRTCRDVRFCRKAEYRSVTQRSVFVYARRSIHPVRFAKVSRKATLAPVDATAQIREARGYAPIARSNRECNEDGRDASICIRANTRETIAACTRRGRREFSSSCQLYNAAPYKKPCPPRFPSFPFIISSLTNSTVTLKSYSCVLRREETSKK